MKRSPVLFFTALVVMMCISGREALACSCMWGAPPCEAFGQAQAVFIGSVTGVSTPGTGKEVSLERRVFRFSVEQIFFGVEGGEVEVATGMGGGDCGYGFQRGVAYLVYAYRNPETGRLSTSICTRTRRLGEASEDLAYIREAMKGKPGVSIYGEVHRVGPQGASSVPQSNLRVTVKGEGGEYRVLTDAAGKYRVANLSAGKYEVGIELADGVWTRSPKREFTLAAHGCARADFTVEPDGRIVGRVVDELGQGVSGVMLVALIPNPDEPRWGLYQEYATSEEGGRFLFRGLPPGRYYFRITHARSQLYPHSYYPGVQTVEGAYAIDVGEGQKIEGVELRLAPAAREYPVNGVVVWPDGRPAADVEVAWGVPNENFRLTTRTDEQGRFTVRLFAGFKFWVNAAYQDQREVRHSSGALVEPRDKMEPLRLVLKPQGR